MKKDFKSISVAISSPEIAKRALDVLIVNNQNIFSLSREWLQRGLISEMTNTHLAFIEEDKVWCLTDLSCEDSLSQVENEISIEEFEQIFEPETFEEKVRSLTIKEIFLLMVKSLRNPHVEVDMDTFGDFGGRWDTQGRNKPVCYGCCATNLICEVSGITFKTHEEIEDVVSRAKKINTDKKFLDSFEEAIDNLRRGFAEEYNMYAEEIGIAVLPSKLHSKFDDLEPLRNGTYKDDLDSWEKFANDWL